LKDESKDQAVAGTNLVGDETTDETSGDVEKVKDDVPAETNDEVITTSNVGNNGRGVNTGGVDGELWAVRLGLRIGLAKRPRNRGELTS
jgi:hypothetical protein